MNILFVCTGNTCRSSMAGAVAKRLLEDRPDCQKDIVFTSAGLAAIPGEPASREAVSAVAEMGIDLGRHRASLLTPEALDKADLVLTMTLVQQLYVKNMVPSQAQKVFTLADYAGDRGDVPDPIGQPLEAYRICALRLRNLIGKVLDRLEKSGQDDV